VLAVVEVWLLTRFIRRGVTTGDGAPIPSAPPERSADDDTEPPRRDDDVLSFAY
jgi:cytochrome d ubiquinol oxidase subunit I